MRTLYITFTRCFFAFAALCFVLWTGAFYATTPVTAQSTDITRLFIPMISTRPTLPLYNGDFELGRLNWFETSLQNQVILIDITSAKYVDLKLPVRSGKWIAWLGGEYNENSTISQKVTITRSKPYLTYWQYIASIESCAPETSKDVARILINSNVYLSYDLCRSTQTNGWKQMFIDLSAYAGGEDVTVAISVVTDATENSNLFLDDVTFTAGPGSTTSLSSENPVVEQEITTSTK